ncbi:MAG: hypothetical protein HXS44_04995 [Theionarchaea archaeon]|nr:hypothetical protein [Theionarchaea archaeon]
MATERELLHERYQTRLSEELALAAYIPYTLNKDVPFLGLYKFEEAFSYPLVLRLLRKVEATESDLVFDPFCGSGTTLFTSFVKGIPSVGIDALPVAWFVSKTLPQFLFLKEGEILNTWKALLPTIEKCEPAFIAEDVPIMKVAFEDDVLLRLRKMKTAIDGLEEFRDVFLFLFFSLLEECSRTQKKKRYPRALKRKGKDPFDIMKKRVDSVERDIERHNYTVREENMPDVFMANILNLSIKVKHPPSILITSPPYPDKIDYTRSYALELCFHFVKDFTEFKRMRYTLLKSYIESNIKVEEPHHFAIGEVVTILEKRENRIADMLRGYFQDMNEVIKIWYAFLSNSARVSVVLENPVYHGEPIPVDLILSDMAEETGFSIDRIIVAGYKEKNGVLTRKSILMWRK